jgi:hypothetical protein
MVRFHDPSRPKTNAQYNRLSSSIAFYRKLMGIRSVRATTEGSLQVLHLEYDVQSHPSPSSPLKERKAKEEGQAVTLVLGFDETTRRLFNAKVRNREPFKRVYGQARLMVTLSCWGRK